MSCPLPLALNVHFLPFTMILDLYTKYVEWSNKINPNYHSVLTVTLVRVHCSTVLHNILVYIHTVHDVYMTCMCVHVCVHVPHIQVHVHTCTWHTCMTWHMTYMYVLHTWHTCTYMTYMHMTYIYIHDIHYIHVHYTYIHTYIHTCVHTYMWWPM